jgi:hypothetical protein
VKGCAVPTVLAAVSQALSNSNKVMLAGWPVVVIDLCRSLHDKAWRFGPYKSLI